MKYYLGLDISTSCTGICLIDENEQVIVLDAVKLTSTTLSNMWEKADKGIEEIKKLVGDKKIERIFVEANAKMFSTGFSSADTLLTLAKFNGLISYLSHKAYKAEVVDVNVTSARKAVGFKNTKVDKRPVKKRYLTMLKLCIQNFLGNAMLPKRAKAKDKKSTTQNAKT